MRGAPGDPLLRDRQRDPGADRALARQARRSSGSSSASTGRPRQRIPDGLFTYVNYPSTEYLELPFLDLVAFNVFLEDEASLRVLPGAAAEPRRRPAAADHRGRARQPPQRRGGPGRGAAAGRCATPSRPAPPGSSSSPGPTSGTAAATTSIDWDFGLVDRERRPKPALAAVRRAFAAAPFAPAGPWPRVSVVVCTHNGASDAAGVPRAAAAAQLPGLRGDRRRRRLAATARPTIARAHGATLVADRAPRPQRTPATSASRGPTGEIVAFLDDDAYPDPDWLHYLAVGCCAERRTPAWAGRTSRPRTTAWSPSASPPPRAARSTS